MSLVPSKTMIAAVFALALGGCVVTTAGGGAGAATPLYASAASDSGVRWVKYRAPKYGFSMLVPAGTKLKERQFGPNWGELTGKYDVVRLVALARLHYKATPDEIERVGVKVTGIAGQYWKVIGHGRHQGGWIWWKTVTAELNGVRVIGDYGVGAKSSYLMLLITTNHDFNTDRSSYRKWYQSIRVW